LAVGLAPALGLAGPGRAQGPAPDLSPAERQKLEAQAKERGERMERHFREGRLTEALEEAERRLEIEQRLYPPSRHLDGHPDLATAFNNLGLVFHAMGRYELALERYEQALAMSRRLYPGSKYPDGHAKLASVHNNLGSLLETMGRHESALDHLQQALEMQQRLYPPSKYPDGHYDLAVSHNNLASLLYAMGRYDSALDQFQQTLAIDRRLYPPSKYPDGHAELATDHNNIGALLAAIGRQESALDHHRRAMEMRQRLYPPSKYPDGHPELAASHNNLGLELKAMGGYEAAMDHFQRALAMRQRLYPGSKYPDGHPHLAESLGNLGWLLQATGRYDAARDYLQQALEMQQRLYPASTYPEGHRSLADSHASLGFVLEAMGRYEPALDHHRRAMAMNRRLYPLSRYPDGHPDLVFSLSGLGSVLRVMGQYEAALDHLQQALAMQRRLYPASKYPDGHPQLAVSHNNLGELLPAMGRYEPALDHLQQALAMQQRLYPSPKYPDGHHDLAATFNNLGLVLQAMGRYEPALEYHRQELAMHQRLYPPSKYPEGHPHLASGHYNLGLVLQAMGRNEPALDHFEQAVAIDLALSRTLSDLATESQARAFRRHQPQALDALLSASWRLPEPACVNRAWPRVWTSRAAVAHTIEARHDSLAAADLPRPIRDRMEALLGIRRRLARQLLQPLPSEPAALARRDREVAALAEEKEGLERELARQVPALAERSERDRIGPADLAGALPPRSAHIELLRYTRSAFDPARPGEAGATRTPHYVAFVVPAAGSAHRVELGPAAPIEEALADWRHAIDQRRDCPAADVLRRLAWEPLAGLIGHEVQTVYLVPDGALARLPWAALPGSRPGTVLLEQHAIAVVPHGPFLVQHLRKAGPAVTTEVKVLAVGGVQYDVTPAPADRPTELLALNRGPNRDGAAVSWPYLRGTEREVRLLGELAGPRARLVAGAEASTARLLQELPRARLAHLATHGFFNEGAFRAEQWRAEEAIRGWHAAMEGPAGLAGAGAGAASPLSYTGLVLAGANRPEAAGPDGGILTGEMILGLDLRRLELAVLSACQTGLGAVADGECVQNLQRAFHVAGCADVIASLWSVPDESTAALMAVFYEELLGHHKPPLEALRSAQLWVYRNPGRISERAERGAPRLDKATRLTGTAAPSKSEGGSTHGERAPGAVNRRAAVRDWAGFILSGPGR
jgi:tetratricopeptide (TPR) repeat protein